MPPIIEKPGELRPIAHFGEPETVMVVIAGEQLVGGRARDCHLESGLMDRLGERGMKIVGDRRNRCVVIRDQPIEPFEEAVRAGLDHLQIGVQKGYGLVDIVALVVARIVIDDREGVQRGAAMFDRDAGKGARIDAAAEAKRDRHVRAQPEPYRIEQTLADPLQSRLGMLLLDNKIKAIERMGK